MFYNTCIPIEDEHLKYPLTQTYQISTHRCFGMVNPLRGNIHGPSQRNHLEQFINAKEKYYRENLQEIFS
jgi:hypothetical protein